MCLTVILMTHTKAVFLLQFIYIIKNVILSLVIGLGTEICKISWVSLAPVAKYVPQDHIGVRVSYKGFL